jgi:sucrose-6-phosphatase
MKPNLFICTDLDRTLIPNGKQIESPLARPLFAQLIARQEITLAYVTGRNRNLVQEAIRDYQLPNPNWVIGDVGSTIYQIKGDDWQQWHCWEQEIARDWQGLSAYDLSPLFQDLSVLTLQESHKQNRYKLSYYLPLQTDIHALQQQMIARLEQKNLTASLIYSVDEAAAIGLLDVLPLCATKLHAVEFLMRELGFDLSNTIFAGDSGNDLPVLVSHVSAVLVANADKEVVKQAKTQAQQKGTTQALYLAKGDFLGLNGYYSAGILEGIAHYHPYTRLWMQTE